MSILDKQDQLFIACATSNYYLCCRLDRLMHPDTISRMNTSLYSYSIEEKITIGIHRGTSIGSGSNSPQLLHTFNAYPVYTTTTRTYHSGHLDGNTSHPSQSGHGSDKQCRWQAIESMRGRFNPTNITQLCNHWSIVYRLIVDCANHQRTNDHCG